MVFTPTDNFMNSIFNSYVVAVFPILAIVVAVILAVYIKGARLSNRWMGVSISLAVYGIIHLAVIFVL